MSITLQCIYCHRWKSNRHQIIPSQYSQAKGHSRIRAAAFDRENESVCEKSEEVSSMLNRRAAILSFGVSLLSSAAFGIIPGEGLAVVKQGLLAGRVPGLSEPDEQG